MAKFPIPMNEVDVYTIDELKANLDPAVLIEFRKRFVAWLKGADEEELAAEVKALEQELTDDEWLKAVCGILKISLASLNAIAEKKKEKEQKKKEVQESNKKTHKPKVKIWKLSKADASDIAAEWQDPLPCPESITDLVIDGNNILASHGNFSVYYSQDLGKTWKDTNLEIHAMQTITKLKHENGIWFVFTANATGNGFVYYSYDLNTWGKIDCYTVSEKLQRNISNGIRIKKTELFDVLYLSDEFIFSGICEFDMGKYINPHQHFCVHGKTLDSQMSDFAADVALNTFAEPFSRPYAPIAVYQGKMILCCGCNDIRRVKSDEASEPGNSLIYQFDDFTDWTYNLHSHDIPANYFLLPHCEVHDEIITLRTRKSNEPLGLASNTGIDSSSYSVGLSGKWFRLWGLAIWTDDRMFAFEDNKFLTAYNWKTDEFECISNADLPEEINGTIHDAAGCMIDGKPGLIVVSDDKLFIATLKKAEVGKEQKRKNSSSKKKERILEADMAAEEAKSTDESLKKVAESMEKMKNLTSQLSNLTNLLKF